MEHNVYERNGTSIVIPVPQSYKDVAVLIKSDYYRRVGRETSVFKIWLKTLIFSGADGYLFWFRIAAYKNSLWGGEGIRLFANFMRKRYGTRYGIQLPSTTKVGYGLMIQHSFGTIVNPDTIIGNNVTLCQFVNIGSTRRNGAMIGDGVFVHPMVCIVNDVVLGENATVGAGAVVVKDVPKDATVAGVPAKVLSYDRPGHFIGNRWPIER